MSLTLNPGEFVAFLDIEFCFDNGGSLQTDLHIKETASRSYLYFGSSHPNHVFSGVVYSQCLRLRRIINNQIRLEKQLDDLSECFIACNYPKHMVQNITAKVKRMERRLDSTPVPPTSTSPDLPQIRVISTFGADTPILDVVEKHAATLSLTQSLSSSSTTSTPNTASPSTSQPPSVFQFVKRTGSSLRRKLVRAKSLALGENVGKTKPCNQALCLCCDMITDTIQFNCNGKKIRPAGGTCTTHNLIYCVVCTICNKPYVGRTVQRLNHRISGHRGGFNKIIETIPTDNFIHSDLDKLVKSSKNADCYTLGLHLYNDHDCTDDSDFNKIQSKESNLF